MTQETQINNNAIAPVLYMAMELSHNKWKLGFVAGGHKERIVDIEARDLCVLREAIEKAKSRFGLPENAEVKSCYEAGRDGFWIHRALTTLAVTNIVVDPASIEINRRGRKAKTDRIDVCKLLRGLMRYEVEGPGAQSWSVVRVPSEADEDERRLHRELERLKQERTAHRNRIQSLLITQGIAMRPNRRFGGCFELLRRWDGAELPAALTAELVREHKRLEVAAQQIGEIESEQKRRLAAAREQLLRQQNGEAIETPVSAGDLKAARLQTLRGIGPQGAWILSKELFGWRQLRNRKQVGALVGLTPTPFASGKMEREQGISKSGARRVRSLAVELAWFWLHFQPESELTKWFYARCGEASSRSKRVLIVALARKLLVALWRYVEFGQIPAGATLKKAAV